MKILAIETSCDETALALIEAEGGLRKPIFSISENIVSSQIAIHRPWGGVVPSLAKREHLKNLPLLFRRLFPNSKSPVPYPKPHASYPDLIAVTVGPGLEPALWTGINFAQEIHRAHFPKAKLVGVNHLEGHLYSFLLPQKTVNSVPPVHLPQGDISHAPSFVFPAIVLLVSGGHTMLLFLKNLSEWKRLGETRDDAVGESFDKVARLLGLPYPGGPEIEKLAKRGNANAISFPRPMMSAKNYDFSFSGLKTSVLYYLRDHKRAKKSDVAASFQEAAVDVLTAKTIRAAFAYRARSVVLCGGVAANKPLRLALANETRKKRLNFFAPPPLLNTDNAAMIAAAAYFRTFGRKRGYPLKANGNLNL